MIITKIQKNLKISRISKQGHSVKLKHYTAYNIKRWYKDVFWKEDYG
jgi:hypothetical protein